MERNSSEGSGEYEEFTLKEHRRFSRNQGRNTRVLAQGERSCSPLRTLVNRSGVPRWRCEIRRSWFEGRSEFENATWVVRFPGRLLNLPCRARRKEEP